MLLFCRDFDPFSLRLELPMAVAKMHRANRERGTVYVHCTAGLGRAPAVAVSRISEALQRASAPGAIIICF